MASDQPSWPCLSGVSILHDDFTGNESGAVAVRTLQEPTGSTRKIVGHFGPAELHLFGIDDIHVGLVSGCQYASIKESVELRCMLGHAVDGLFERNAGAT